MLNNIRGLLTLIYVVLVTSLISLLLASIGKYLSEMLSASFLHEIFILIGFCLGGFIALITSHIFKYESLDEQWEKYEFLYILRDRAGFKIFENKLKKEQHLKKIKNKYRHKMNGVIISDSECFPELTLEEKTHNNEEKF